MLPPYHHCLLSSFWGKFLCARLCPWALGSWGALGADRRTSEPLSVPSPQMREREVKLWDTRHFSSALTSLTLDTSPG